MTRRILVTIVATALVAVVALLVPAGVAVRRGIERGELLRLQRDASIVVTAIPTRGPVDVAAMQAGIGPDVSITLHRRDGSLLDGGPATGAHPDPVDPVLARGLAGDVAEGYVDDDLVAVVPARFGADGPELIVRLQEDRAASRARIREALAALTAMAAAIVAAAGGAGALLARRFNRPVERLRHWAAQAGPVGDDPPPPPTGIEELDGLRATLIEARTRLTDLLLRERSFSSQVSHQLRTPVAALRVALEAELETPRDDPTIVLREGLGAVDHLETTIDSLLSLARHSEDPSSVVDLLAVAEQRAAWWRPSYRSAGRTIGTAGGPVRARADRGAVQHILDVLVENALRHGRGPVTVRVSASGDEAAITVVDEGGTPDGSAHSDRGHGIGLQMARSLAELSGGRLHRLDGRSTRYRLTLGRVHDGAGPGHRRRRPDSDRTG